MVSLATARVRQHLLDELNEQIKGLDAEIDRLIKSNPEQEKSLRILTSVLGVDPVLLRILYSLIYKGELYDKEYIQIDPRSNQEIRKEEKAKWAS